MLGDMSLTMCERFSFAVTSKGIEYICTEAVAWPSSGHAE